MPLDYSLHYGMYYGMAIMTYRTTFALDKETWRRLKRLSNQWHVSQAEVVRRALSQAEQLNTAEKPNPVEMLKALHAEGKGMVREAGEKYLTELREDRKHWRGE